MANTRIAEKNVVIRQQQRYLDEKDRLLGEIRDEANFMLDTTDDPVTRTVMQTVIEEVVAFMVEGLQSNASDAEMDQLNEALVARAGDLETVINDYTETRESKISQIIQRVELVIIMAAVIALVFGALIAIVMITSMISKPLSQLPAVMKELAAGNLDQVLVTKRTDEIGELMTNTTATIQSLQQLIGRLGEGITQLAFSSEQMSAVAQENTRLITEQKNETDQVATAMNEMTATVREVAQNAEEASSSAEQCEQLTREGGDLVRNNIKQTEELADEVAAANQAIIGLKADSDKIETVLSK